MNGEDVYDVARHIWCSLCDEPHEPCEDEYRSLDLTDEEQERLDRYWEQEWKRQEDEDR